MKKICFLLVLIIGAFFTIEASEGDTITFRSKNKLEWSDFRMNHNFNDTSKLSLSITIVTFTKKVNVWWGTITVESFAGIRRDSSWIKPEYKIDKILKYVQLKYEIANYFAKECEKEINRKKINAGFTEKIGKIIETYISKMNQKLKIFDIETDYGNKEETIDIWRSKLVSGNL